MNIDDKHALLIGQILWNLQSLEFVIRASLFNLHSRTKPGPKLYNMKVGDSVEENELTDYAQLNKLIKRYNNEVVKNDSKLVVDETLVALRDALAHGRVSSETKKNNYKVLKFSKPKSGNVEVVFSQEITETWLIEQKVRVCREIVNVLKVHKSKSA